MTCIIVIADFWNASTGSVLMNGSGAYKLIIIYITLSSLQSCLIRGEERKVWPRDCEQSTGSRQLRSTGETESFFTFSLNSYPPFNNWIVEGSEWCDLQDIDSMIFRMKWLVWRFEIADHNESVKWERCDLQFCRWTQQISTSVFRVGDFLFLYLCHNCLQRCYTASTLIKINLSSFDWSRKFLERC